MNVQTSNCDIKPAACDISKCLVHLSKHIDGLTSLQANTYYYGWTEQVFCYIWIWPVKVCEYDQLSRSAIIINYHVMSNRACMRIRLPGSSWARRCKADGSQRLAQQRRTGRTVGQCTDGPRCPEHQSNIQRNQSLSGHILPLSFVRRLLCGRPRPRRCHTAPRNASSDTVLERCWLEARGRCHLVNKHEKQWKTMNSFEKHGANILYCTVHHWTWFAYQVMTSRVPIASSQSQNKVWNILNS